MIEGVSVKELKVHGDERGKLFEILRSDESIYQKFGQVYITVCYPGWVKGWHYHKVQDDFFCTVKGRSKIVLFDKRASSKTEGEIDEYLMSADKPQLLRIPKGVIHGFECVSPDECWIMNIPTEPYMAKAPDEFRYPLNTPEVPYEPWKNSKGY